MVVERLDGRYEGPRHLCLDKGGFDNPTGRRAVAAQGYRGHIRRLGEEKLDTQSSTLRKIQEK